MSTINHIGLVVADLARSRRFYEDVLGFTQWFEIPIPDEAATKVLMLDGPLGVTASYLVLDGLTLELIHYGQPGTLASPYRRSFAHQGLSHLSLSVEDIHATAAEAARLGGEVVEATDTGTAIVIRDPDGQLIELLHSGYRDNLPPRP